MVCAPVRSIIHSFKRVGLSTVQAHKPCSFLTCTMIPSVDLARYGASRAKNLGIFGLVQSPLGSLFSFQVRLNILSSSAACAIITIAAYEQTQLNRV